MVKVYRSSLRIHKKVKVKKVGLLKRIKMRIAVFLKAIEIKQEEGNSKIDFNPSDKLALIEASKIIKIRGGDVVAYMIGDKNLSSLLSEAYGANEAILISDSLFSDLDPLSKAEVILSAIKKSKPFDVYMFGEFSQDSSDWQLPYIVAEKLSLPHISKAIRAWNEDSKIVCECVYGEYLYIKECRMPVVISMLDTLLYNEHFNYEIKPKEIKIWDANFLGIKELKKRIKITDIKERAKRKNILIEYNSYDEAAEKLLKIISEVKK